VYVQADSRGRPLRIGMASRGLSVRYRGGTGYALEAAAHGSRNQWFVARVPVRLCAVVEKELIWSQRAALRYNSQGKRRTPRVRLRITHVGSKPLFGPSSRSSDIE
jgi:hypothetical protein